MLFHLARHPPARFPAEGGHGAAADDLWPADALGRPARSRCTEPSAEPAASGAVGELCGPIALQVRRLHMHMRTCIHVQMAARTPARSAERSADVLCGHASRRCDGEREA